MTVSVDTNILIYVYDHREPEKREIARQIRLQLLRCEAALAGQVCSEFLNAARRKRHLPLDEAHRAIDLLTSAMTLAEQQHADRGAAVQLASSRNLQFYDALLCATLARVGVRTLLSEDMSDGDTYGSVTVLNPFNAANAEAIERAFRAMGA